MDEATLDDLRAAHGEIYALEEHPDVIFRRPTAPQYKRFRASVVSNDPRRLANAAPDLCKDVVVHPTGKAYDEYMDRYPGLPDEIALQAQELARGSLQARAKKLTSGS